MPTSMEEKTSDKQGSAEMLGKYLAMSRQSKGLTLRQVEEATEATGQKVSNAYLSQLENGKITKPSAQVLYSLSTLYGVPYELLMEKAGYLSPTPVEGERHGRAATLPIDDLSDEEERQLLEFLSYLRYKRKKR